MLSLPPSSTLSIHYFDQDQMPLLTYMIEYRIQVRLGYFINQVRPAWPGQNMIRFTRMTQSCFTPGLVHKILICPKVLFLSLCIFAAASIWLQKHTGIGWLQRTKELINKVWPYASAVNQSFCMDNAPINCKPHYPHTWIGRDRWG